MRTGRLERVRARVLCAAVIVAVGCLAAAVPHGSAAELDRPPPELPQIRFFEFSLPASDGYRLELFAADGDDSPESASLSVTKDGGTATYTQPRVEVLTKRRIEADFGPFGAIRVEFEPQGREGDGRACSPFRTVKGSFRGTIRFRGDDGFTSARATRASGTVTTFPDPDCRKDRSPIPPEPVILSSCSADESTEYFAFKDRRGDFVFHQATTTERQAGLRIFRSAFAEGPTSTFTTKRDLSAARVMPGAPFTGSASFSSGELTGDLSAPVPGRDEPLVVTPGKATLEKGFPFRSPCSREVVGPGALENALGPRRTALSGA